MNWLSVKLNAFSHDATTVETYKVLLTISNELSVQSNATFDLLEYVFNPLATDFLNRLEREQERNEEFTLFALKFIDDCLNCLNNEIELRTVQLEATEAIGELMLRLHYNNKAKLHINSNVKSPTFFALTTLSIINKVATLCPNYVKIHISELLGLARAHGNFGLSTESSAPQKVQASQHLLFESSADEGECSADITSDKQKTRAFGGGKLSKKRKPRSITKTVQSATNQQFQQQQQLQQQSWRNFALDNLSNDRTSDSDVSEVEIGVNQNCSNQERQNRSKVRFAAISLFGVIATRIQNRKIIYAYWHAFFENTKVPNSDCKKQRRCDLLNIALHDPNIRCRTLALQVASQLIFSSKSFLEQAECNTECCSCAFLPFSQNLGFQVLSLYDELIIILSNESSLTVLTQALKCLAVLVQATTPFKRFQPRQFVFSFVKEVQRLIQHNDAIIQVAALMVIEFLIATPTLTPEISLAIGAPHKYQASVLEHLSVEEVTGMLEIDNSFEEFVESDCGEDDNVMKKEENDQCECKNTVDLKQSWLLKKIFRNVDVEKFPETGNSASIPTSVRIESFQVITALGHHIVLLQNHLDSLANGIESALQDSIIDVRACSARCLDTIAYRMGQKLLEFAAQSKDAIGEDSRNFEQKCLLFWSRLLPIIMTQISSYANHNNTSTVKVCLCDALSNIGVIAFEKQTYTLQMNLITFLSGIANDPNEEISVSISAVRALAVYVLFPCLRGNLVFIENTAETILRFVSNSNLPVRIKALWALGNISDALLIESTTERISNNLLWRLICAATNACNDNDKIRCNAVRALGNLLCLLNDFGSHSNTNTGGRLYFRNAITKIMDCLRTSGSAKVKWNTCYAIGKLLQNNALFESNEITINDLDWQSKLFSALANVIVHNQNFKVRINAANAITRVTQRKHFGAHFSVLCKALFDAIEQSNHLDNFYEYNHRDHLQEQLCLAISHLLRCSTPEDYSSFRNCLETRIDVVRNTWTRVVNRMVPEKSAPICECTAFLQQELKNENVQYTSEQRRSIEFIIKVFESQ